MVYIVGAGPGDPELITVKGRTLLEKADIIVYAGSLVNKKLLDYKKEDCEIYDSAGMNLDEVIKILERSRQGKMVVRLHTGDPSIYGAIREQMDMLLERQIPYEVVPGVSSFCAVGAALKKEYTLPGVTQTVILTRMEGRTEVPQKESITSLAEHNATMVIFLSVHMLEELTQKLRTCYPIKTPIAVVYKASWPEEKIIQGTLEDICKKVSEEKVERTALVVVGDFLGDYYELSKLYHKDFTHGYRGGA